LILFFGAGVNLTDRPPDEGFALGRYLPDAEELALDIAEKFDYPPDWGDNKNLLRVSWYAARHKQRRFQQRMHSIFSADYPTTGMHEFFARLPGKLAAKGYHNRKQLIVTTNYDRVLERAFDDASEPYDLLTYIAYSKDGREVGKFRYIPHGGEPVVVDNPRSFLLPIREDGLERTIILKIHGAVDPDWHRSSFVVTEDDYIDYLARINTPTYHIPKLLVEKMQDSSFLFLGYSLGDWNMRVLLNSIWSSQAFSDESWAVMKVTAPWDEEYWQKHNVKLMKMSLAEYVAALDEQLEALPAASGGVMP
jgi:hypothetical protein